MNMQALFLLISLVSIANSIAIPTGLPKDANIYLNGAQRTVLALGVVAAAATIGIVAHTIGKKLDFYSKCYGTYPFFVAAFSAMAGYIAYSTMCTNSAQGKVLRV